MCPIKMGEVPSGAMYAMEGFVDCRTDNRGDGGALVLAGERNLSPVGQIILP